MYEVDMEPNWDKAPEGATHYLVGAHGDWWIKVGDDGSYHHRMANFGDVWIHDHKNFIESYEDDNWVITPRPQIQPKQQGEHKMFTAKQLKDTYPHKQMRMHIAATVADAAKRPAALGQLVKKFMANCEKEGQFDVPMDVDGAFLWDNTPEGHEFWRVINLQRPRKENPAAAVNLQAAAVDAGRIKLPKAKVEAKAAEPKPAPKQQVGWW